MKMKKTADFQTAALPEARPDEGVMTGPVDRVQGMRLMRAWQRGGLNSFVSAMALTELALHEVMDMTRLAESCGVSKAGMTGCMDVLVAAELVTRGPVVGEDRRKVFVRLTDEGLALVKRVYAGIKEVQS
jgi:DNA-binding MarR family transcriptional regulator